MTEAARILTVATAMGLDPYLTLGLLGVAALTGWSEALPADAQYLAHPAILGLAVFLFALEAALERKATAGTVWCALQLPVRPVAASLGALYFMPPAPPWVIASVMAGAAALGVMIQSLRCGGRVFLHACTDRRPSPTLVGLAEDAATAGLLVLAVDLPLIGGAAAVVLLTAALPLRAWMATTPFVILLIRLALVQALSENRWRPSDEFPGWLRRRAADQRGTPEAALRGFPAAMCQPTRPGALRTGWLVIAGAGPRFIPRSREIDAISLKLSEVRSHPLWMCVTVDDAQGPSTLLLPRGGPTPTSLRAEMGG